MPTRTNYLSLLSTLLLTCLLMSSINSNSCGEGCLSCSKNVDTGISECSICDIFKSYIMTSSGCTIRKIPFCEVPSLNHISSVCLQCIPGYVVDNVQGKCVAVNFASVIPNCERYTAFSTCQLCTKDHYMMAGTCLLTTTLIDDCEYYSANGKCARCKVTMFLEQSLNKCSEYKKTPNCASYNHIQCDKCKTGYTQDLNFYLKINPSTLTTQYSALSSANDSLVKTYFDENCFEVNVTNCMTHENANECHTCNSGYYLSKDKQCVLFPRNRIRDCIRYTSHDICSQCDALYYLDSEKCLRRTLIDNCVDYNTNNQNCIQCTSGYMLYMNTCKKRQSTFNHCKIYKPEVEKCKECEENFTLNDAETVCFENISNCYSYSDVNCDKCNEGFFLEDNNPAKVCLEINFIPHCKKRVDNRNQCEECQDNYFIQNHNCIPYEAEFCENFMTSNDRCDTCIDGFQKIDNICKPIQLDNCKTPNPSETNKCDTCLDGYYKSAGFTCHMHNLVGCKIPKSTGNECMTCDDGFKLNTSTKLCIKNQIAYCLDYDNTVDPSKCKSCGPGYQVNSATQTCIATIESNCTSDSSNYKEPLTLKCVSRNNKGCDTYEEYNDMCKTCPTNHYLFEGKCLDYDKATKHCGTQVLHKDECEICNNNYYLDDFTKQCYANKNNGCATFVSPTSSNSGYGCSTCDNGFILNTITKLCEEIFIPNCLLYEDNEFECKQCQPNSWLSADKWCYKNFNLGCEDLTCSICKSGWVMVSSECVIQNQPNCKKYSTGLKADECEECHEGYYVGVSTGLCMKQELENCVSYQLNMNQCTKCENLYYINISAAYTCSEITLTREICVESNGIDNKCSICKPGYKRATSPDKCVDLSVYHRPIENCLGNSTEDEISCSVCESSFILSDVSSYTFIAQNGCSKVLNTGVCEKCDEYYQFVSNSVLICTPVLKNTNSLVCIETTDGSKLILNTNCKKCKDNTTHYLSGQKCIDRTLYKTAGCDYYDENADECKICKEGSIFKKTTNSNNLVCLPSNNNNLILNCEVYDRTQGIGPKTRCEICSPGYEGDNCTDTVVFNERFFTTDFLMKKTTVITTANTGNFQENSLMHQSLEANYWSKQYTQCDDTYVAIADSDVKNLSTFNIFTKEIDLMATFPVLDSCVANTIENASVTHLTNPISVINDNHCALALTKVSSLNSRTLYYCVACKTGYIGQTKKRSIDGTNQSISYEINTCELAIKYNLEKKYTGMGYKTPTKNMSLFLQYDSCSNGKSIITYIIYNAGKVDGIYHIQNTDTTIFDMSCIEINEEHKITNCQIHALKVINDDSAVDDVSSSTSLTANTVMYCAACKPGFSKTHTSDVNYEYLIQTCTYIPNCNLNSEKNTIMNACGECNTGYAWEYKKTNSQIHYEKCVPNSFSNCLVVHTENNKCIVCEYGYLLGNDGHCYTSLDSNCEQVGEQTLTHFMETENHSPSDTALIASGIMEIIALFRKIRVESKVQKQNQMCNQCKEGFVLTRGGTSDYHDCTGIIELDKLTNCKRSSFDDGKCYECNDGYILTESKVCLDASSLEGSENCVMFQNNNNYACIKCADGYSFVNGDSNLVCKANPGCAKYETSWCDQCGKGYKMNLSLMFCEPILIGDPCTLYNVDINNKHQCILCKNPSMVPVNIIYDLSTNYEVQCVASYTTLAEKVHSSFKMTELDGIITLNDPNTFNIYYITENDGIKTSTVPAYSLTPLKVCLPEFRQNLNCKTYNGYGCSICKEGFVNSSSGSKICEKGQISFCIDYTDVDNCKKCQEGFFIKVDATGNSACSEYTKTCLTYNPLSDTCLTCPFSSYLDVTNGECSPYNNARNNCLKRDPSADVCILCEEGTYLDSSAKCIPITVSNCKVYLANVGTCTVCKRGFYLDYSTNYCIPHSIFNCSIYDDRADKCLFCLKGYYLNSDGKCDLFMLKGCSIPIRNQKKCEFCEQGYYLDSDTSLCLINPAIHCQVFNQIEPTCLKCDPSAYMKDDLCTQYLKAKDCQVLNPIDDDCISCVTGFYLDTGKCKIYTKNACQSYSLSEDKCTSCFDGFYLDNGVCNPITTENCKIYSKVENKCQSCKEGFYFDLELKTCTAYDHSCATYNMFKNECVTCKEGYFLNETIMSCEQYKVQNCQSYVYNMDKCLTCSQGYFIQVSDQSCIAYTQLNCRSYNIVEDLCTSCIAGFYFDVGMCKPYIVTNCKKYDLIDDRCEGCSNGYYQDTGLCKKYTVKNCKEFEQESNNCTTCMPSYYLEEGHCYVYTAMNCLDYKNGKDLCDNCDYSGYNVYSNTESKMCIKSTVIDKCEKYKKNSDFCDSCIIGYYLENMKCVENPTGIPNCSIYEDNEICSECFDGFYLEKNNCEAPESAIYQCKRYSSEKVCEQCENKYALNATYSCDKVIEPSCLEWEDPSNCSACLSEKVLTKDSSTNFAICVNSPIENCSTTIDSGTLGIICSSCAKGYYLFSNNQCKSPTSLVDGCIEYISDGVCSLCADKKLLSVDGLTCSADIEEAGENCNVGHISSKPVCNVCQGGFYFNDSGICQKCGENVNNCSMCDINNLSKCLICQQGFYMDESLSCIEYPEEENIETSVSIVSFRVFLIVTLVYLFQ